MKEGIVLSSLLFLGASNIPRIWADEIPAPGCGPETFPEQLSSEAPMPGIGPEAFPDRDSIEAPMPGIGPVVVPNPGETPDLYPPQDLVVLPMPGETPQVYPPIALSPEIAHVVARDGITFKSELFNWPTQTFQWKFNGFAIVGATSSNLVLTNLQLSNAGEYSYDSANPIPPGAFASSITAKLYVYPSAAATLGSFQLTNNNLIFPVFGVPGYSYRVEWTTNFTNWYLLSSNTSPFTITNSIDPSKSYKYFRVIR